MLDIKWIRENPEALDRALKNRGLAAEAERVIALDEARRAHITRLEEAQARRNAASKDIGYAKAKKDEATAARLMAEVAVLKDTMADLEAKAKEADKALDDALAIIPNVPLADVPVGADEKASVEYRRWGNRPGLNNAKQHYELGEALGQMDFETAAKLSGSRFVVLKKGLARLERALGQFMLDLHTEEHGYTEVQPPLLVRDEVAYGTGQLPKAAEDMFRVGTHTHPEAELDLDYVGGLSVDLELTEAALREGVERIGRAIREHELNLGVLAWTIQDLPGATTVAGRRWLIPTAEVPLTNLVRESILDEAELPLRFAALTPCFRSEAGAAGKDTRGMLRQHQFDKVELVSITTPEKSLEEHERMLTCAEEVLKRLDLHYRVMTLSTGDMGFAAQKTYDIEVWLPGQAAFREISSVSVCGDFQARRMQARFRVGQQKTEDGGQKSDVRRPSSAIRLVHTLNGSGVAVGRALIAVMENYQNADGSVTVPDALKPYMRGVERIEAIGSRQ